MTKFGPTVKTKVLIDGNVVAEDVTISLPEVAFQTADVNAMGTLSVPIALTDNIEATIHQIGCDKGFYKALGLKKTKFELRWVENKLKNSGDQEKFACKAFITGIASSIPGGDLSPGEALDNSINVAVLRYNLFIDGKETVLIDKLNGICKLNGKDYAKEINSLI